MVFVLVYCYSCRPICVFVRMMTYAGCEFWRNSDESGPVIGRIVNRSWLKFCIVVSKRNLRLSLLSTRVKYWRLCLVSELFMTFVEVGSWSVCSTCGGLRSLNNTHCGSQGIGNGCVKCVWEEPMNRKKDWQDPCVYDRQEWKRFPPSI